ncbi:GldG family protein [Paenibacillus flagellatus]|uniref:ABC transporter n=1 Tax=Paenibacillus flagellatus TaxID=2211139 RepID=A0A2V5K145_9BACL|nr:GldG family protein [Paenibacillus flagellatus]PYI51223.1 ABC transporter [Paenibacillus flagellatus]
MNKWIKGTNATVLSIAVIGIFIIVTLFLNSLKGIQWDLSANKKYSLSEQTTKMLKELDKDVKVTLFTGGSSADDSVMYRDIRDMLNEYEKRSGKIAFEEVDPNREPTKAQQYQIDQAGTIVFELGDKQKKVYSYELFGAGSAQGSYQFSGEEKFTQAILGLTSDVKHPVYFLTGHGELTSSQTSTLRSSLEGENYVVKELNLYKEGKIPDDAEAVFILGPQNDLDAKETSLLKEFVNGKGKLFVALGYSKDIKNMKNVDDMLAAINVKDSQAVVVETGRTLLGDPFTIVPNYQYHDITKDLSEQNRVTIFPVALAFTTDTANADWKATALLRSTDKAFGETDMAQLTSGKAKQDPADPKGPHDVAYAIQNKDNKPKAIVLGNAQFLQDQIIVEQGNRDFALNSINWLQEQTDLVTIRPREEAAMQQAFIMPNQAKWIFYGTIVIFPLAILLVGGAIWWRRRKG